MSRTPSSSEYQAPVVGIDGPLGAADADAALLLGFCVTARLEQIERKRTWWMAQLNISRSHLVDMMKRPTPPFLEQLERFVSALPGDEERGGPGRQRLAARLVDFAREVRPDEQPSNPQPVVEWLARYPSDNVVPKVQLALLGSEVALKRCALPGAMEGDSMVRASLDKLMRVASGPYGGSTVAHQRCVELGLQVPMTFFEEISRHFDTSPVGFRLLRTLDRFVNVWRHPGIGWPTERVNPKQVDAELTALLVRLGRSSVEHPALDPYPGAEWAITLARDCLRTGQAHAFAAEWLERIYGDAEAAERERLYAAWSLFANRAAEATKVNMVVARMTQAPSRLLRGWGDILAVDGFAAAATHRQRTIVEETFAPERALVGDAIRRATDGEEWAGVRSGLESLVFSALVTADGRLRRSLIESVVAAGLVEPTMTALVEIYHETSEPGLQESAIFFLSRLRESSDAVIDVMLGGARSDDRSIALASLWGLGDVFKDTGIRNVDGVLTTLSRAVVSGTRGPRPQIAAAHALAVIASSRKIPTAAEVLERAVPTRGPAAPVAHALALWAKGLATAEDPFTDPTGLVRGLLIPVHARLE